MLSQYRALGNGQFEIRFMEDDEVSARETLLVLSRSLPSILSYFDISQPFPSIQVILVPDRSEFDRLVRDLLGIPIEIPSNPARIAQPQRTDMVVLAPSGYESHSIFKYKSEEFGRLLIHELVHIVEEYLTPDMETTPRWFSEGLAVYLSEQWRHDDEFRNPAISGIANNDIPDFLRIDTERALAYDWGWTVVRFIEICYGKQTILRMVKECTDGRVLSMTGVAIGTLEKSWKRWLMGGGCRVSF